jgi:hypothetical protein
MVIRIGYVRGLQGLPGPPGPAWAGGQLLLDRVSSLETDINSAFYSLQSSVNQKTQTLENEVTEKIEDFDTDINRKVDEKIAIMESVYIKKDARGSNNGVAELDGNGLVPEFRLPVTVAYIGCDINILFNSLVGKIVESGIFNENEGQIEC